MKAELVKSHPVFKPFTVEITFESENEANAFLALYDGPIPNIDGKSQVWHIVHSAMHAQGKYDDIKIGEYKNLFKGRF